MLGAVLGHEIEHTTKENAALERQGKDPEEPAHNKSRAILQEVTEKMKEKKE